MKTTSIRFLWMPVVCIITTLTYLSGGISSSSKEYYQLYSKLENALITNQNISSRSNLQTVGDVFFPKGNSEPSCVSITYLLCNDTLEVEGEVPIHNITSCRHTYFLWTENAVAAAISTLLFSYSKNAIALKGFDWSRLCLLESDTEIVLQMSSLEYNESLLDDCLVDLTSQLKAFADAQGIPKISNKYRGYAINWNEHDNSLHDAMITFQIIVLSIFIFFCALSSSDMLYQDLFNSIYDSKNHHSTNPGYALYWGVVVLSVIWNIGPSWLVISNSQKVIYSLAILIPLLFIVAITVKKKDCFPIPGFKSIGRLLHTNNKHSFKVKCVRHAIQVFSIWSLLVTFAFIMHYFTTIVLAFYLNPLGSLIKILFIKMVAISSIFVVALLFTIDRFEYICTWSAIKKNVDSLIATITILSLLPLLGYLVFVIGGIIFIDVSHNSSWQSILTIIPAAILLFVSWFSHGLLFPKGIENPTKPEEEVIHDLVGNGSSHKSHPPKTDKVLANTEKSPLCNRTAVKN